MNAAWTLIEAPSLAHDKMMATRFGSKLNQRMRTERKVVANLLEYLRSLGWNVIRVNDGEERTKVATTQAAMELMFNLDEVWVNVKRPTDKRAETLFFVFGNAGWECLNDYSLGTPEFDAAMEAFDFEQFE